MSFLDKKTTWSNKELIPLKLCIASIYMILGANISDWVFANTSYLLVLFFVTLTFSMYLWIKKLKQD